MTTRQRTWIRRRARAIIAYYGTERRQAVRAAAEDLLWARRAA